MWSLGTLKLKPPSEIALQDSSDDFTPQSSPSSAPRTGIAFQRTQPPPALSFSQLNPQHRQDPLDLTCLGISDRPNIKSFKDDSKMDWTPSHRFNTFMPRSSSNSLDSPPFAAAR